MIYYAKIGKKVKKSTGKDIGQSKYFDKEN